MAQLTDILLGSSKSATTGWAATTGRSYDVLMADYGPAEWSIGCNANRIGEGTIGWIVRSDGHWGHVAGILAVEDRYDEVEEENGLVMYVPGTLFPLPREWWIDGARLHLDGWLARAPFGRSASGNRLARFRGGESLDQDLVALIEDQLHEVALEWVAARRNPEA